MRTSRMIAGIFAAAMLAAPAAFAQDAEGPAQLAEQDNATYRVEIDIIGKRMSEDDNVPDRVMSTSGFAVERRQYHDWADATMQALELEKRELAMAGEHRYDLLIHGYRYRFYKNSETEPFMTVEPEEITGPPHSFLSDEMIGILAAPDSPDRDMVTIELFRQNFSCDLKDVPAGGRECVETSPPDLSY